jgi:hypothetical protein
MTRPYTPQDLAVMAAAKENAEASRWEGIEESLARAPASPPSPPVPDIPAADAPRASDEEINAAFERRGAIREDAIRQLGAVPAIKAILQTIPEQQHETVLYHTLDNLIATNKQENK